MNKLVEDLFEARDFLRDWAGEAPSVAMVLGSGFAVLGGELELEKSIHFKEIPHFPLCTNPSHPGRLLVGKLMGYRVAVLQGRLHAYEDYTPQQLVFPVRSLGLWGVESFILTNAAGAINKDYDIGQFMAITDHINLLGINPLCGPANEELGKRFTDISKLYDRELVRAAERAAKQANIFLHRGVYAAMLGPSYESPAEIRMLNIVGADAVGMSTVPEAIALGQMGRKVFALTCLTNWAAGIGKEPLTDDEVRQVLSDPRLLERLKSIVWGVLDAAC